MTPHTPSELILLKVGEVALKGLNRRSFESQLMSNLRHRLRRVGRFSCEMLQSTATVTCLEEEDPAALLLGAPSLIDRAFEECLRVFGFVSATRAARCAKEQQAICETAASYLKEQLQKVRTFKVESKRADKRFPLTSPELSALVGGALLERYSHLKVDLHHPDLVVRVEVRDREAFVHGDATPAAGGLPVASSGRGTLLLSGGIDSPVAGYLMARRGLRVDAIHFPSFPYTSEMARQKVEDLARLMGRWTGDVDFYVVPFTDIQETLRDKCAPDFFTILTRRFMVRIAEALAVEKGSGCLITGESLGQVASQTLQGLTATDLVAERIPILRPLIGLDKDDIVARARHIGTFEKSIEPYEDCCAIFSPKHPKTKPKLSELEAEEAKLDLEAMVRDAVERTELTMIKYGM
ncbi:MAG: tRNA 4-thiouridine(8) synthase ThiI [Clostridia bacterium]|nr:tRNA 4-thiouridine(8) synthase ThiI [Clostridia bacterium]